MSDLASLPYFFAEKPFSRGSSEAPECGVSPGSRVQRDVVETAGTSGTSRGAVLSFRRPGGAVAPAAAVEKGSEAGELEPQEPTAHRAYRTRVEGAAHPIYQLCEEPLAAKPVERRETVLSKKTELDIGAFVEAVAAAFPKPRDPLMPRVLRARPKGAARPFLCFGEETATSGGTDSTAKQEGAAASESEEQAYEARSVTLKPVYDPILEGGSFDGVRPVAKVAGAEPAGATETKRRQEPRETEGSAGVQKEGATTLPGTPQPVEAHERELIQAVIEPQDPVAKPRLPMLHERLGDVPARLSPSQRAQLGRPKMVRDCHGRMTTVEYRVGPRQPE